MTELAAALRRIRVSLVEEATPLPGQVLAFGRPHAHPRTRYEPRYSRTGERLEGSTRVRPDCPRPVRGRCECPPDGTWRPAVGVLRADATAHYGAAVPGDRARGGLPTEILWVTVVHELDRTSGFWRCRRPTYCALQHLRGAARPRYQLVARLVRHVPLRLAFGAAGLPADPERAALGVVRTVERWAQEEREAEYERRPRQWFDRPREPRASNTRPTGISESQAIAESTGLTDGNPAATVSRERSGAEDAHAAAPLGRPTRSGSTGSAPPYRASLSPAEATCA